MKDALRHVPNVLTGLRLIAAPALAALLSAGHFSAAFGVFAGASDAADGFLAKRFGLVTPLGRILDPAADKVLMLVAFVMLSILGETPPWLAVLVIGRDALIVLGIAVAVSVQAPLAIQPLSIGRLATVVQVIYVGLHLASPAFGFDTGVIAPADAYGVVAVTLASAICYAWVWLDAMRAPRRDVGKVSSKV